MIQSAWTYILTNRRHGTLYVGVTRDIARRMTEHRTGNLPGFASRYNLHRLVLVEHHDRLTDAITREKQIKNWHRSWKLNLIEQQNPTWRDLFQDING
ncbi:GIY-YIG nuclease family protein [Alphaproteobacteria bacterium HT1-32]|nr:GIY-YIG nuclease family protein [Alphaproteobacteria bacterium HT1-32]|tara:strand:+ start:33444 stop:33737 length:294 start_codon:yes stop_codon:yes gene_type:complete